jgi:demethylmenaquinone methyltransferase/2-methoxy-6-polyprenyl-1,4-benzoquinol methylase
MRGDRDLPSGKEKERAVRQMFDAIAPRYDLVNRVMTFGMDRAWRRRTVASLHLSPGGVVADVACGTGDLCREIQAAGGIAIGFDVSHGMLDKARTTAPLVQGDGLHLPLRSGELAGVTCGFALRNVVDIGKLFVELARVLRPGARVALLEVAEPGSGVVRLGHRFYFHKVVPLIGGLLSDRAAYRYLPRSTAYLPPPAELLSMLTIAGFEEPSRERLGLGAAQLISATRS